MPTKDLGAPALIKLVDRDPPQHPRTAKDDAQRTALEAAYTQHLITVGAAINALGELRDKTAAKALVLALYRTPELALQLRRALVATGPGARDAMRGVLEGKRGDIPDAVARLVKARKLDAYCGDRGDLPAAKCLPVSLKDFYAAIVAGDFHDAAAVPALLRVLDRPALPAYYTDDEPGPTQHTAAFEALRKIGAPAAAAKVLALWKRPDGALATRVAAAAAYPFLARDATGVDELGKIAADNAANDDLRIEAATAFARLSRSERDIAIVQGLAQKYLEASAKKRVEADGKPKAGADKADAELAKAKAALEDLKQKLAATARDKSKRAADIEAATQAAKKGEDDLKLAKQKHKDAVAPYKQLDAAAKAYKGYARMFQFHIARIAVAVRCKADLACYAQTLALAPIDVAKSLTANITDMKDWTVDDKVGLLEATVDRAMLELGKAGPTAERFTDALLDNLKSEDWLIRQAILLALPKLVKLPCSACPAKLDAAIQAGTGKPAVADLAIEIQVLRNYFELAGRK